MPEVQRNRCPMRRYLLLPQYPSGAVVPAVVLTDQASRAHKTFAVWNAETAAPRAVRRGKTPVAFRGRSLALANTLGQLVRSTCQLTIFASTICCGSHTSRRG